MLAILSLALALQSAPVIAEPARKSPGVLDYRGDFPVRHATPLATLAKLTVNVDKPEYQLGDAARIRLTLTNASDRSLLCHCNLVRHTIDIEYAPPGEDFRLLRTAESSFPIGVHALYRLEPGESVWETTIASYDFARSEPVFSRTGMYRLRATYHDDFGRRVPESRVSSDAVEVEVRSPDHPLAYEAYRVPLAEMVGGGQWVAATDEVLRTAADFLDRFPSSRYAEPVRRLLTIHLHSRLHMPDGKARENVSAEHFRMYERYRKSRSVDR